MDVSAAKLSDGGYLVAGGCSDGILRVWIYAKNEFKLMRSLDNHGRCVLKVNLAEVSRDSYCLVSAATDGRVLCWRIDGTDVADEPCVMYQAHQSGVNGMDVRVDEGVMNVLSCGDDCSVSIFAVGVDEWCLRDHGCVELAHTSNATGVCFLSVDQFVSCSVDQDIHVWRIGRGDACVIEKVRTIETCVPDICDMSVSKDEDGSVLVAVSGMGAQLIKL
jgi:WD40 repeat protein